MQVDAVFPVMAGLVPAIHVYALMNSETWMPGNAGESTQTAHAWLRAEHNEEMGELRHSLNSSP
jgi:hypothetical protein